MHRLPIAAAAELLTLVKQKRGSAENLRWPIPCARSYEGYDWEVVRPRSGPASALVQVSVCRSGSCSVSIPDAGDFVYEFRARNLVSAGKPSAPLFVYVCVCCTRHPEVIVAVVVGFAKNKDGHNHQQGAAFA